MLGGVDMDHSGHPLVGQFISLLGMVLHSFRYWLMAVDGAELSIATSCQLDVWVLVSLHP